MTIHPADLDKMISAIGGAVAASLLWWAGTAERKPPDPQPPAVVLASWAQRVEALEARADAAAKLRCLNVQTDRFDMMIVQAENLGTKKVIKP